MVKTVTRINNSNLIGLAYKNTPNWIPTRSKNINKKNKRKKVNYFFEECLKMYKKLDKNVNNLWIGIFEDAIVNKFPRHIKYNTETNTLYYSYYNNKENIKLDTNPEIALNEFIKFVQNHACIYSSNGLIKKNIQTENINWGKTSDSTKMSLIDAFVVNMCKKISLSYNNFKEIKNKINLNIITGNILPKHIKIDKNIITDIENIEWDQNIHQLHIKSKNIIIIKTNKQTFKKYHLGEKIRLHNIYTKDLNLKSRSDAFIVNFLK